MTIREQNEQREHTVLEPWATFADSSAGRLRPMEPCPYRTCFQRDRDRIIHSTKRSHLDMISGTRRSVTPERRRSMRLVRSGFGTTSRVCALWMYSRI